MRQTNTTHAARRWPRELRIEGDGRIWRIVFDRCASGPEPRPDLGRGSLMESAKIDHLRSVLERAGFVGDGPTQIDLANKTGAELWRRKERGS